MLGKAYKPLSNEQIVISLALQDLPNTDSIKRKVAKEFIQCVLKLIGDCFHETEALPISNRAMALERAFVEKRSIGVHYMAVKKSWEKLVFDPSQSVCPVSVELLLQQVLQHFWYTPGSRSSQDANVSNANSLPTTTTIDPNQDNDSIRDHAGWAVKRARDVISKGQNELPVKETVSDDAPIIFGNKALKADALTVLSLLGEDQIQPDGSYRFCIHEHVVPFFIFLHTLVKSLLSPVNVLREKGNILKFCLDHMSTNKELRARWNEFTKTSDMRASLVVLQRVATFFIKSKQQIYREQEGLKPNKKSVALRQQIRCPVKKGPAVSSIPTRKNQSVAILRSNFNSSSVNAFLLNLQTLPLPEQEHTLGNLQGKELAKILKALGKPAFLGKKKEKQIKTLLEAVKGGLVCVKVPDEVRKELVLQC